MKIRMNPYFVFDGNAKDAVAFYEQAFDAQRISVQTFGEMPSDPSHPIPDAMKDRIMHAHLKVGETDLMFSDTFAGMPHTIGNQVTIALSTSDADLTRRLFDTLAEGGNVQMPLQKTFWSEAYGQLTDKFGVTWQLTTETNH